MSGVEAEMSEAPPPPPPPVISSLRLLIVVGSWLLVLIEVVSYWLGHTLGHSSPNVDSGNSCISSLPGQDGWYK